MKRPRNPKPERGVQPIMRGLVMAMMICGLPATASAQLDKQAIRKAIKKHLHEVIACYEPPDTPKDVTTTVTFVIGRDGKVTKSEGTGPAAALAECLAHVVAGIVFPKSDSVTSVSYPFGFIFAGN